MTNVKHTMELECEIRGLKVKADLYDIIQNQEPHGSAIDTMAQEIKELKEYKAEVERLAKDDTLWHNVEKLDKLKYKTQLYDEFFDAVNIPDAIDVVREWKRNDELWKKLEPLFLDIVGEHGDNEGAVDVLTRLIKERDNLKERYKNTLATLLIQEHKLDKIKYEFIDCDEYPPLTKFWKEEILEKK